MKILVANIGSTSFKYRLYDMAGEVLLARGGVERIGSDRARSYGVMGSGSSEVRERIGLVADHGQAVRECLDQLTDPGTGCLADAREVAAIGFKTVLAEGISGVQRVDDRVLATMEAVADVAPAHNPPYIRAMRMLRQRFPEIPLVAAFETGFHEDQPAGQKLYAVPLEWAECHGIKRHGFHGASHRYIAGRMAELLGRRDTRLISCHLGGSSSIGAIRAGRSVAHSLGMSPQSGLPHSNRVGDFDPFALPVLIRRTGRSLDQLLDDLASRSGLQGLSGVAGGDVRDIEAAAGRGDRRAQTALEVFIAAIRHYVGAYLFELGGADAIVFTGGIGENSSRIRAEVCRDLDWFGIALDPARNRAARGEARVSAEGSRVAIWCVPTNEEIVVARQAKALLEG